MLAIPSTDAAFEDLTYAKVARRLIFFLFVMFVLNFVDRVNVSYAKLQFAKQLGMSNTAYGIGAGIFFLGYFLFEVPSNLLFQKIGARVTMCRIMVLWGVLSSATMFMHSEMTFYALRFALGAAEAGFFPGVILYLTYWFPDQRRAKAIALFYLAVPVAGVICAPFSGWLLAATNGAYGLQGWQWMFLIEGVPPILIGIAAWLILYDKPADAPWLSPDEKALIMRQVEESGAKAKSGSHHLQLGQVLCSRRFWAYTGVYFCIVIASSSFTFWLPQVIRDVGITNLARNGQVTAIPYLVAGVGMYLMAKSSEKHGERVRHYAVASIGGALMIAAAVLLHGGPVLTIALFSIAYAGVLSCIVLFWPMPSARLPASAVAGGLAAINSLGNLAGYVSGNVMGSLRDAYGNTGVGMLLVAASLTLSGLLVISIEATARRHEARELTPDTA